VITDVLIVASCTKYAVFKKVGAARDALRRKARISKFEKLRRRIRPFAAARGFLTDEDVLNSIS